MQDEGNKLTLFAVGDDDQNIYSFDGASVEFIRRFTDDYQAKPQFLVENYRSSANIIDVANLIIQPASERMKAEQPITIDRARRRLLAGGAWEARDPVARGRVQVLPACESPTHQALAAITELQRLAALDADWKWSHCAVIAREWRYLEPVRAYCEHLDIPVQMADNEATKFWKLRETQALLIWLRSSERKLIDSQAISLWLDTQTDGPWWALLREGAHAYGLETAGVELPVGHFIEWLAEWGREARRRQSGLLLLTAHSSKGLEFEHVVVLDGGWDRVGENEDLDAPRRLYYVAVTRAKSLLVLCRLASGNKLIDALPASSGAIQRAPMALPEPMSALSRRYQLLTPADVDLGFSGRFAPSHPIHQAISALRPGSTLEVRRATDRWELLISSSNIVVGRLSRGYNPPRGFAQVYARVHAIIIRRLDDEDEGFRRTIRSARWEIVLPELLFES
ncbi:3'-5' exonuclease [Cupriavidus metallidurans]|uniref:3'-5' exonuclease n=1 Tax=Cupriavidus metallidurans TaxID=119219 RepID=UPI001CCB8A95|nr:3'-5' exonuclease [Cupriavidus metallidurans]UBM11024.1 ATP-binding domain-containing protein [Cupriavidus metallidurans]